MKTNSVLFSLIKSFRPVRYHEFNQESPGVVFKRLAVLAVILAVLLSGRYVAQLSSWGDIAINWAEVNLPDMLKEHFPEVNITDGVLSSPVEQPYIRKFSELVPSEVEVEEEEDFVFVLDTTGEITSLEDYPQGVLVLQDKMLIKTKSDAGVEERREVDFDEIKIKSLSLKPSPGEKEILSVVTDGNVFSLTYEKARQVKTRLVRYAYPILLILLTLYYFIAKTLAMYIFSLYALFFDNVTGKGLNYRQLLDITSLSIIPPTILALVYNLFGIRLPYLSFAYIGFMIIMLTLAIKSFPQVSQRVEKE